MPWSMCSAPRTWFSTSQMVSLATSCALSRASELPPELSPSGRAAWASPVLGTDFSARTVPGNTKKTSPLTCPTVPLAAGTALGHSEGLQHSPGSVSEISWHGKEVGSQSVRLVEGGYNRAVLGQVGSQHPNQDSWTRVRALSSSDPISTWERGVGTNLQAYCTIFGDVDLIKNKIFLCISMPTLQILIRNASTPLSLRAPSSSCRSTAHHGSLSASTACSTCFTTTRSCSNPDLC